MSHNESFANRPRIAHITNHGYAGVDVPYGGAPDTGGQNVYVNFIVEAMVDLGYHVTVFTRGGFPFFDSERMREGIEPYGEHARYVYVPGGEDGFIRKEDIATALDEEVDWLERFINEEAVKLNCHPWEVYEFIDAHYWDAGVIGMHLTRRWRALAGSIALEEVLGGVIEEDTLARQRLKGGLGTAGLALDQVVGGLLLEETDTLTSQEERVESAVSTWCRRRDRDSATDVSRASLKKFRAASKVASTALAPILAADVVGNAVLDECGSYQGGPRAILRSTERLVFTPHSLSVIKEENYRDRPREVRRQLKFCERRDHEVSVCIAARAFAATSTEIAERLRTHHEISRSRMFYFPAGVDRTLFKVYTGSELDRTLRYLTDKTGLSPDEITTSEIVFETSRMDRTKRKDVVLDAFARVVLERPKALCLIGGGPENEIYRELEEKRRRDPVLMKRSFLLGFIPDEVMYPLFSMADVFVTPSEMEGFGLSAAQAAAVGTALITSHLVPFALQYVPEDALIVRAGDVQGFADAMIRSLSDHEDRLSRGRRLAERTASLDWIEQTKSFLAHLRLRGLAVREP